MLISVMSSPHRQQAVPQATPRVTTLAGGDGARENVAWMRLIARHDRTLRSIARSYRLGAADVDDVVQVTWTRLYQNIDRLCDPNAIAGWLATTTRREAMRVLQRAVREQPVDELESGMPDDSARPEVVLLAAEEREVLGRAIAALPGRQRDLLRLLATDGDADYARLSETLDMPVGSIGPIRARGLARLARNAELRSLHVAGP
jgi:RNA polymerase sigma factor (sigma-70 family)